MCVGGIASVLWFIAAILWLRFNLSIVPRLRTPFGMASGLYFFYACYWSRLESSGLSELSILGFPIIGIVVVGVLLGVHWLLNLAKIVRRARG